MLSSCSLHFNCILAKDIHNIFLYVQAVNQLLTNMVKKTYRHGVSKFYVLSINYLNLIDSHFWTQSGAPSSYLAFRAPPTFKLYMVLKACPAFNPYLGLRAPLPPLSSYIWC